MIWFYVTWKFLFDWYDLDLYKGTNRINKGVLFLTIKKQYAGLNGYFSTSLVFHLDFT